MLNFLTFAPPSFTSKNYIKITQLDMWGLFQPETLGYLVEIQRMHIEDLLQPICCVGVQVRLEGTNGVLM